MTKPYLDCYQMHDGVPELVPGRSQREWMDKFAVRQPYRCLPLTMANSTGWEILCPFDLTIEWDGGPMEENIQLSSSQKGAHIEGLAISHFRAGIVTFHTGHLFRTPPGWAIWAMGPPNLPKDGIYPLSGLVETDWLPFPFTMNWQMTRPGTVTFAKGEAFCFFTMIEHHSLEDIRPQLKTLDENPELKSDYELWGSSRAEFIEKLRAQDPDTVKSGWQRHYMRGETPSGDTAKTDHITKRRLQKPKR